MSKSIGPTDLDLFTLIQQKLFAAVIGDVMDGLGYQSQFLPPQIRPLVPSTKLVGRAMPVLEADDVGGEGPNRKSSILNQPFGLMLHALDDLKPGEIYLCSGASPRYALWGELMSSAAINRGARGAVVNGYSRDTEGIIEQNFPTFSWGCYAQDQRPRGKVIDFRCKLKCGEVEIQPGDLVVGDIDGVCIIPRIIENDVIKLSLEKAEGEKKVYKAIKSGMGALKAWETFGIM